MIKQIDVLDFNKIKNNEDVFLLDVRSASEFDFVNIGGELIPLDELMTRTEELPRDKTIFCLCHHGVRSLYACQLLKSLGLENVVNIQGGIDQWSLQVDNQLPRY